MLNKIPKLFNLMIPDFTLPPIFATIGEKLPQFPHGLMLCAALNIANKLQLLANQDLTTLENKNFCVRATDTGGTAFFTYKNGFFMPIFNYSNAKIDLTFVAKFSTYLQLLTHSENANTLIFNRSLILEGDENLVSVVKQMLDSVEFKLPDLQKFGFANALNPLNPLNFLNFLNINLPGFSHSYTQK